MIHLPDSRHPVRDRAPRPGADAPADAVAVLYENDAWLSSLFAALAQGGVPYCAVRMDDAAFALDGPPPFPLVINRVSPSSYLRGHGPAIPLAWSLLEVLDAHGCRVVNGSRSFRYETSKISQHLLLRHLGVATPATMVFNNQQEVARAARDFPFPAILKPSCGGSGAFVRRIEGFEHLMALLAEEPHLFAPDHLLLLQQEIASPDGTVVRTEFIDGALVYAMRVHPHNTFNLCPADACERHAADPGRDEAPRVEFEPFRAIAPDAVAQAREIVRATGLDVGGVEFMEDAHGTRWFFDINATSVYREEICSAFGVDGPGMLVEFIAREYHKEVAKRAGWRAAWTTAREGAR